MTAPLTFANVIVTTPFGPQAPSTLPIVTVPVGIGSPSRLRVTFGIGTSALSFSSVTGAMFIVTKPDGSTLNWAAQVLASTSTSITFGYVFDDATDVNFPGLYSVGVEFVVGSSGVFPANPFQIIATVLAGLDSPVTSPSTPVNPYPIVTSITIDTVSSAWDLEGWGANGQSLMIGFAGTPVIWGTGTMLPHQVVHDSSGTYDITNPNAGTLSLVEAAEPFRTLESSNPLAYPLNIAGETCAQTCRAIRTLALASGYPEYVLAPSVTGQGGQPYSVVGRGGSGNAYAALLYEFQVQKRVFLAANPGKTYGVGFLAWEHGEADATAGISRTLYANDMKSLQAGFQSDVQAITGQFQSTPLFMAQQNSEPSPNGGVNPTSTAMLDAHDGVSRIVYAPKYWMKYGGDNIHPAGPQEYQKLEEKRAQAVFTQKLRGKWEPFRPIAFASSGTTITITFNVPFGPPIFDLSMPQPHASGNYAYWALGQGLELYDHVLLPIPASAIASTVGPIAWTLSRPHPYNTGDIVTPYGALFSDVATDTYIDQPRALTVTDNLHFSQTGTVGQSGTFVGVAANSVMFRHLQIMAIPVWSQIGTTTWNLTVQVDRPPNSDWVASYGIFTDQPYTQTATGGYANGTGGCGGRIRDQDPFVGPDSGVNIPNWCVQFSIQAGL